VGSKLAISAGEWGGLVTLTREYSTPKPTTSATVLSSDHAVDGWVRNLVHSERSPLAWVTRWRVPDDGWAEGWVRAVIGRLPWSWARGTRPRPW
jgi:hypothetical protein